MRNAVLALDLGQHTGYAWCAADALYTGVIDVSVCKHENRHGEMFSKYTVEVTHLIKTIAPQAVHYEDATFAAQRHSAQAACWFGFRACLLGVCYELKVPVYPVSTSTYKARAGITKSDGKNAVIKWCEEHKIPVRDYNEADAVAILNAVLPDYKATIEQFTWRKS